MEGVVVGCVRVDGNVSYLCCPLCYANLCDFRASFDVAQAAIETDSSSDDSQNRDDEVYNLLRCIAGSEYAQVTVSNDMWVACSSFRELERASVDGRAFGCLGDFQRIASELAWEVPSGVVVINLVREHALVLKDGQKPNDAHVISDMSHVRRCA